MKTLYILRPLLLGILIFMTTSCKKDDDANNGCVKEENFFEAELNGEVLQPYYNQGGGFGLYTLYLQQCTSEGNSWLITVRTEDNLSLYISLINIISSGNYPINIGNPDHVAIDCAETTSIYIEDEGTNAYTYLSTESGQVEISEYESGPGKIVGTFTCIMTSTENPSLTRTITGQFNLNKSTLDNTKKPCWL